MIRLRSAVRPWFRGRPSVWVVPAAGDPRDAAQRRLLLAGRNVVCYGMYDAFQQLLLRNFDDWQPATIALGFGGDFSQTVPAVDQGARVEPLHGDDVMRKQFYAAPLVESRADPVTTERKIHYVAVVRPEEANTDLDDVDAPYLNEFGLLAANGTLLAHFVPPTDGVSPLAGRYAKSSLEWLVVDWEIEVIGVEP